MEDEEENYDQIKKIELNINFNINNIINTEKIQAINDDINELKEVNEISTKSENLEINHPKILVGPRIKHQKRNIKEDIELQIACEDAEEKKERLKYEKEKKKELILKKKNLIYKIDDANYNCVDCGKEKTSYISINNGVTLCESCSKIHKKFGNEISYVLNINDELDEYLFNFIVFGSNTKFKRFLEEEKVDKDLSIKKKYKINAVVFYRKNLKNKIEGKKFEKKNYSNPNEISNRNNNEYPEFNEYNIEKCLIKNGELKKNNTFVDLFNSIFSKKIINRNKILLRSRSSVNEKLIINKEQNENKNKINNNIKKFQNSMKFDNDKIKESSRPFQGEKTEQDKNGETEETPRIKTTKEPINDNNSAINNNK